jgi:hypothetical protein
MTQPDPSDRWDPRPTNQQFYSADPATYFRTRLRLLALAAGRSADLDALLIDGVEYEGLHYKLEADADRDGDADSKAELAFLTTESQVLLHHAAEALIRLFLAHAKLPACPWIECARLVDFRKFHAKMEMLTKTLDQDARDDFGNVFIGEPEAALNEDKRSGLEASIKLVQVLARRLTADKKIYNAAKHGMTVFPSQAYAAVKSEEGAVVVEGSGASIAHMEFERRDGGIAWYEKTTWVSIQQAMWLTELAVGQIDLLWGVAKARYLNETPAGLRVITVEAIDAAFEQMRPSGAMINFRRFIAFERGNQ